jgi:uncharacterized cupredoxin-like copper-binding protein
MKRQTKALAIATALAASLAAVLAAAALARPSHTSGTTIQVRGGKFFFKLSATSAPHGTIPFKFKNAGHVAHAFKIAGKQTPTIEPGKTTTLVVKLTRPGKYPFNCTVPGHAQAGMRGVFKVT